VVSTCRLRGLLGLIVGVGLSRLILESHWLSDILGAYLAGGLYLLLCPWLFAASSPRGRPHPHPSPLESGPQPSASWPVAGDSLSMGLGEPT
jgi:membrane-associated phospholipid phosphatase